MGSNSPAHGIPYSENHNSNSNLNKNYNIKQNALKDVGFSLEIGGPNLIRFVPNSSNMNLDQNQYQQLFQNYMSSQMANNQGHGQGHGEGHGQGHNVHGGNQNFNPMGKSVAFSMEAMDPNLVKFYPNQGGQQQFMNPNAFGAVAGAMHGPSGHGQAASGHDMHGAQTIKTDKDGNQKLSIDLDIEIPKGGMHESKHDGHHSDKAPHSDKSDNQKISIDIDIDRDDDSSKPHDKSSSKGIDKLTNVLGSVASGKMDTASALDHAMDAVKGTKDKGKDISLDIDIDLDHKGKKVDHAGPSSTHRDVLDDDEGHKNKKKGDKDVKGKGKGKGKGNKKRKSRRSRKFRGFGPYGGFQRFPSAPAAVTHIHMPQITHNNIPPTNQFYLNSQYHAYNQLGGAPVHPHPVHPPASATSYSQVNAATTTTSHLPTMPTSASLLQHHSAANGFAHVNAAQSPPATSSFSQMNGAAMTSTIPNLSNLEAASYLHNMGQNPTQPSYQYHSGHSLSGYSVPGSSIHGHSSHGHSIHGHSIPGHSFGLPTVQSGHGYDPSAYHEASSVHGQFASAQAAPQFMNQQPGFQFHH